MITKCEYCGWPIKHEPGDIGVCPKCHWRTDWKEDCHTCVYTPGDSEDDGGD